jgi:hypothetical protein
LLSVIEHGYINVDSSLSLEYKAQSIRCRRSKLMLAGPCDCGVSVMMSPVVKFAHSISNATDSVNNCNNVNDT